MWLFMAVKGDRSITNLTLYLFTYIEFQYVEQLFIDAVRMI